ncbi:uncharacterized protein [Gossypium hirsutum]|uniref:Retrotransposon gag domain-containing protein n=1 Tax=Gossypium hirsutum TaxID=3635 RepID=A0A1U8PAC4_GOSHI|nr:uncharacterized protein LOC107955989 [Gossypium hirsutum]
MPVRRREFLNLTQGDRSVVEYGAEFLRLSRYARGMVATEYQRCVRFEDDLRDNLRVLIAPRGERDFAALVDKANITDEVKHAERQNRERSRKKRDSEPSKHHIRDCPRRSDQMQAFGMGIAPPRRASGRGVNQTETRQLALVYAARHREDGDAPDVITGSTHSYVACSITENLGILVESTSSEITVFSPFGEFDLILGMDWLVKNRVSLDCATKRVIFRTEEDSEVVIIGEHQNYLSNVISALRARKLVRKGCEVYLA